MLTVHVTLPRGRTFSVYVPAPLCGATESVPTRASPILPEPVPSQENIAKPDPKIR